MELSVSPFKEINDNKVHIWTIITSDISIIEHQKYFDLLSKDEKLRTSKFRFAKDRKTYVVARGVLRILSGYYLNENSEEIKFEYEKFGKPKYKNHTNLKFNVSHSGNIIIIGFVKEYELGVDIEYLKRGFDVLDIAENFFSRKEIKALHEIEKEDRIRAFFRCWTRKESFIKAEGRGLLFPLDKFSVTLDNDLEVSLIETHWNENEKDEWSLFSFIPYKDYIAAISVKGFISDYIYREWEHTKSIL